MNEPSNRRSERLGPPRLRPVARVAAGRRARLLLQPAVWAAAALLSGCAGGASDGGAEAAEPLSSVGTADYGDLRIRLAVDPPSAAPGGSVTARLTLENVGGEEIELESVCPELAFVYASRSGEDLPLPGTGGNCFNAISVFEVPAGETLTETYALELTRRDGEAVAPGTYQVRTEYLVPELPNVDASFQVE